MSKHPMHRALAIPLVAATLIGLSAAPADAGTWSSIAATLTRTLLPRIGAAPCCYGSGIAAAGLIGLGVGVAAAASAAYVAPPVTYFASPLYAVPAAVYVP